MELFSSGDGAAGGRGETQINFFATTTLNTGRFQKEIK